MADLLAASPTRIQRRRVKGWRLPPDTICVDRTTKWGNPFRVGDGLDRAGAVAAFREHFGQDMDFRRMVSEQLAGKHLACFCSLGEPCHADVLLEWANKSSEEVS